MSKKLSAKQYFVTHIEPSIPELPSFEILTLPGYPRTHNVRRDLPAGLSMGRRKVIGKGGVEPLLEEFLRSLLDGAGLYGRVIDLKSQSWRGAGESLNKSSANGSDW
jgi:hypothetical protein